jgi:hypothetical protein
MVHMGGLTFDSDDPSSFLKLPNHIAAERLGMAILDRISLCNSLNSAPRLLKVEPDIEGVLAGYRQLIKQRDTWGFAYDKESEQDHRDIIWHAILENPVFTPEVEYRVRKVRSHLICYNSRRKADILYSGRKEKAALISLLTTRGTFILP